MNLKYDIHLSAYKIAEESIKKFEILGFKRDEFANNTRCETTTYHGTYRGTELLPNTILWNTLCTILENDDSFSGGLEEEEFDADSVIHFENKNGDVKPFLPLMETEQPNSSEYKACDIHINIDLDNSSPDTIKIIEALGVASFDKPKDGKIHRIFTVTTETLEDGQKAFEIISDYIKDINGLKGKIKLERTTRYLRKPSTAYSLPLTNKIAFQNWLNKMEGIYAK